MTSRPARRCASHLPQAGLAVLAALAVAAPAQAQQTARIRCRPLELYAGDTLVITMTAPHGGDLAITTPDLAWFPVSISDSAWSMMPRSAFLATDTLRLATDTLAGVPYVHGATNRQPVFAQPGTYRIDLAENLRTEDVPVYSCRVRFHDRRRPRRTPSN